MYCNVHFLTSASRSTQILYFFVCWFSIVYSTRIPQIKYTMKEESPVQTSIGNILLDSNLSIVQKDNEQWNCCQFMSALSSLFVLAQPSTDLTVKTRVDREALCPNVDFTEKAINIHPVDGKCLIDLIVVCRVKTEPSREYWIPVLIEIEDIDDHDPEFLQKMSPNWAGFHVIWLMENVPVGFKHPLPQASDLDIGRNAIIDYRLGVDDTSPFGLEKQDKSQFSTSTIIHLIVLQPLDYEIVTEYRFNLIACASENCDMTNHSHLPLVLRVKNVNDNPPRITYPSQTSNKPTILTVSESIPIGASILRVEAEDKDFDANGQLTFSIDVAHMPRNEDTRILTKHSDLPLEIDPKSGEIKVTRLLSASQTPRLHLIVTVTDNIEPILSTSMSLIINVTDTNNHSPSIEIKPTGCQSLSNDGKQNATSSNYGFEISTTIETGTHVGWVMVSDADLEENGQVTCQSELVNREQFVNLQIDFQLQSTGVLLGRQVFTIQAVRSNSEITPDIVKQQSLLLLIICQDHGTPYAMTSSVSVKIDLVLPEDQLMCFEQTEYQLTIEETNETLTNMMNPHLLEFTDRVHFTLMPTFKTLVDTQGCNQLEIDEDSGKLKAPAGLDREIISYLQCSIIATDLDSPGGRRSAHTLIRIQVTDVNDNTPILSAQLSHDGLQLLEWDSYKNDNSSNNLNYPHLVGIIDGYDPDNGSNGTIKFAIEDVVAEGNPIGASNKMNSYYPVPSFNLNPISGQVTINREQHKLVDREQVLAYTLRIRLYDSGMPEARSSIQFVRVYIIDLNDNFPSWDPQIVLHVADAQWKTLYPSWTPVFTKAKQSGEFMTKLHAIDPDKDENSRLTFEVLNWSDIPEKLSFNKRNLPKTAYHLQINGELRLWTLEIIAEQQYILGVLVRDQGRTRCLRTNGYILVHKSDFEKQSIVELDSSTTGISMNRRDISLKQPPQNWFLLNRTEFLILVLACLSVFIFVVGGIVFLIVKRMRSRSNLSSFSSPPLTSPPYYSQTIINGRSKRNLNFLTNATMTTNTLLHLPSMTTDCMYTNVPSTLSPLPDIATPLLSISSLPQTTHQTSLPQPDDMYYQSPLMDHEFTAQLLPQSQYFSTDPDEHTSNIHVLIPSNTSNVSSISHLRSCPNSQMEYNTYGLNTTLTRPGIQLPECYDFNGSMRSPV